MTAQSTADHSRVMQRLAASLQSIIQGKSDEINLLLMAVLAGGSVLIEDVPGVGKTTLAKGLARALEVSFARVQFTPDLLPGDILGSSVYNPVTGEFVFRKGPIFSQVLLADEINRASPRTQSALLEAMSEGQVTIDGKRYALPEPFIVLATQNPIEFHGTYPLPEAQLDRFLAVLSLGYPDPETELRLIRHQNEFAAAPVNGAVLTNDELRREQAAAQAVAVEESVARYVLELVARTRSDSRLRLGASPRGSLMLYRAAQAVAYLAGRKQVLPDDVQLAAKHVLPHRLQLRTRTGNDSQEKSAIVADILKQVRVPV